MRKNFLFNCYEDKDGKIIREYLYGLFKTKRGKILKHFYFLGIKFLVLPLFGLEAIRFKLEDCFINIAKWNARLLTASIINKGFLEYKGIYRGKTVVLVGAGPTVNNFIPIKDAIYVGCNRAFLFDKVKFDYLFAIDKVGIEKFYDEFFNYDCIKFIGDQNLGESYQIPEDKIPLSNNIHRYITDAGFFINQSYPADISTLPLHNPPTVSLQALQFILYTQPAKVYLVGIDCTNATQGHFEGKSNDISKRSENLSINDITNVQEFIKIKSFAKTYYPSTEIISINPVGLKGIFNDIYTNNNGYIDKKGNPLVL